MDGPYCLQERPLNSKLQPFFCNFYPQKNIGESIPPSHHRILLVILAGVAIISFPIWGAVEVLGKKIFLFCV